MTAHRRVVSLILVFLMGACVSSPADQTTPAVMTPTKTSTRRVPASTLPAPTEAPPGRMRLSSVPPGATIRLDGIVLEGETPWGVDVQPGKHEVQMELAAYKPWTKEVEVASGSTIRIEAQLEHLLPITVLIAENWPEVAHVQWEQDGKRLRFAVGHYVDAQDTWSWYLHDLTTGVTEEVEPPSSNVSDEVRADLGLCPLDLGSRTITCTVATVLYESPSGNHMVYAPPEVWYGPDGKTPWGGHFRMWYGDTQGLNRVYLGPPEGDLFLGEGGKPWVIWSPREDWVIIDSSYDVPELYLAKADGSVFTRFPPGVDPDEGPKIYYAPSISPVFSPNGEAVAFVGMIEGKGGVWVIDVEGRHLEKVSDRIGLLQWSTDGNHLYLLQLGNFAGTLYRIDMRADAHRETTVATDLPFGGAHSSSCGRDWALSPDEAVVAYYGVDPDGHFGIVELRPEE